MQAQLEISKKISDSRAAEPHPPAVVFYSGRGSAFRIAALSLLDRLVVAIHRGGAGPITIVYADTPPSQQELKRTRALRIPVQFSHSLPPLEGPVLLASANLLASNSDIRRCILGRSRLSSPAGEPLPLGVAPKIESDIEASLASISELQALKPARLVRNHLEAKSAQAELWASMTSTADGIVDRLFNRPLGRFLSKALVHTPITPNTVSILSGLIGILSAFLFADGSYRAMVLGAILFQLSAIIDCVDGDVARVLFKESPLGKWIDLLGDQVVHAAVFAGIAIGVFRAGAGPHMLWLGVSAIIGATLSLIVVLRGMGRGGNGNGALQRLIDAATNRDFSVLVLLLALIDRIDLFLWLAAIGSHIFWIIALALQFRVSRPAGPTR